MARTKDGLMRSLNDTYLGANTVQVLLCNNSNFTEESGIAAVVSREVVSPSYQRAPAAFSEVVWSTGSARAETDEETITFSSQANETYTFDSIVILVNGTTLSSRLVSGITGELFTVPQGHSLAINHKVVLTMDSGAAPAGIPMETLLWVTYVVGNEIKLSASQGGSPYSVATTYTGALRLRYANGTFDSYESLSSPETILSSGQYNVPIRMFMKNGIS